MAADDEKIRVRLLEEQTKNLDTQIKRLVSHMESEQRVYGNQGKLIDQNVNTLQTHQRLLEKHEAMLINNGKGVLFRIDRIEQRIKGNKENIAMGIAVISFLISIADKIIALFK